MFVILTGYYDISFQQGGFPTQVRAGRPSSDEGVVGVRPSWTKMQSNLRLGNGIIQIAKKKKKKNEKLDDTCYDLPSIFMLDEFSFKSKPKMGLARKLIAKKQSNV